MIFSTKRDKPNYPSITFGEDGVVKKTEQRHLGIVLDKQLNIQGHIKEMISRAIRGIG